MAEPNGLYYMKARYYDPSVGRFISQDPLGFAGGDVNLYGYVRNDPVNLVDPNGKNPMLIAILAGSYYFLTHHEVANAPTSPCDKLYNHDAAYNHPVRLGMIPALGPLEAIEDTIEIIGAERIIAGYEVGATSGLVGNTYNVNVIWLMAKENAQGLGVLVNALRSEASAAGATEISISGTHIVNENLINISEAMANRFGLSVNHINEYTIILHGSVR
jgi:RHS repeat-associated protein